MQKVVETEGEGEQDGSVIRNANGRLRVMEHWRGWGGGMRRRENLVFMGNKLEKAPLQVPLPHRKFDSHALPHCGEDGAPGDARESVQRTVDARLVTGEGWALGTHFWGDPG